MALPIRPPIIVHHMAALDKQYPPNSLEAVRACLEAHAEFIEIDVTALHSSDYLLVHDSVLDSETTGEGEVAATTVEHARTLNFKHSGEDPIHVPLLSEIVEAFEDYGGTTRLQIDFKNMIPFPTDEPLHRFINLISPLKDRVIVSTGADWQLRKMRTMAPWLDLGLDVHFYIDEKQNAADHDPHAYPKVAGAYGYWDDHPLASMRIWPVADYLADKCGMLIGLVPGMSTFYISHILLTQSLDDGFNWAERLHESNIKLDVWTVDVGKPVAEANAVRLLKAGVDQFTTNTPAAMRDLLSRSMSD